MGMYKQALEKDKQTDQALQPDAGNRFDELYKQYMDEPKRKRMRERGIGPIAKTIIPLTTALMGGIIGEGLTFDHKKFFKGKPQSATGPIVGGGAGVGVGLLAAALLNKWGKEAIQAKQEDEAWRYAAMLSGRMPDPRNTLV